MIDIAHTIMPSVLLAFIRSCMVADSPGSHFDCVVIEFQPINLTCLGHHLLPALSSRWGMWWLKAVDYLMPCLLKAFILHNHLSLGRTKLSLIRIQHFISLPQSFNSTS